MNYRGAYRISRELLAKRLGISPLIYKVEITEGADVVFHCYDAQSVYEVADGAHAPEATVVEPRF